MSVRAPEVANRIVLDERELQLLLEPRHLGLVVGHHLGELRVAARRVEIGRASCRERV